jgi:hypothetical protein
MLVWPGRLVNDRCVDRSELAALLNNNMACVMARDALASGADFRTPQGAVSAVELMRTYRVRLKLTAAKTIATVGMAEAVRILDAAGTVRIAIGGIDGPPGGWHFVIFIDCDSGRLLACAAVERLAL